MKYSKNFTCIPFCLLLLVLFLFENCGKTEEEKPNKAPSCNITSPANNEAITLGTTVTITVSASDTDGSVANVKISIDGSDVATLTTSPYTYDWNTTNEALGSHNIKAVATDNGGLTAMSQVNIELTALAPTVTTGDVTSITNEAATFAGEVTDDGGDAVTARGFVWDTTNEPTLDNNAGSVEAGSGTGAFTATASGLMPFTEYYVRAYATNSSGTSYGNAKMFKTLEGPPVVKTPDINNITAYWASGTAELINNGGDINTTSGIVWSTSQNPDYNNNEGFYDTTTWSGPQTFEVIMSGLKENTTYYVRAFGKNSYGVGYGAEVSFTTEAFTVQTGTFTDDRDNKQYKTVTIFGQTWMAENLAYLPEVCPPDTECGYWVYDYPGSDVTAAKATSNYTDYGVLYNWEIAKSACPAGWHLPTTEEWSLLEMSLGMGYHDAYNSLWGSSRGTDEGTKLKEAGDTYWDWAGGTNIAKFNARGAGARFSQDKKFYGLRTYTYLWTSSLIGVQYDHISVRALFAAGSQIEANAFPQNLYTNEGYAVRCIKD